MQKHLPLISVTVATLVVLAALHFLVFAPKKNEFERVQQELAGSIDDLKRRIDMIDWIGEKPDPRLASFSWEKLLEKVEETYDGTLEAYDRLIGSINVDLPTYPEDQLADLILEKDRYPPRTGGEQPEFEDSGEMGTKHRCWTGWLQRDSRFGSAFRWFSDVLG